MKISIVLLTFLLAACSKENIDLPASKPASTWVREKTVINSKESKPVDTVFQKKLDQLSDSEMVKVEELKLYQNKNTFPVLMEMLKNSKAFFYTNQLALSCDKTTEPFIQLLIEKAKQKVDVRMILNKGFALLVPGCVKRLKEGGVKIVKAKVHSSYFFNDQNELLIGSQCIGWMFFESDGFNHLDRDMMLYSKGPLATDALKDFASLWNDNADSPDESFIPLYENSILKERALKKRGVYGNNLSCRFIAQRPKSGQFDIEYLLRELVTRAKSEIIFSGVRVDTGTDELGRVLKEKSFSVPVDYIGNGLTSGNGELSIQFDEWIGNAKLKGWPVIPGLLSKIKIWDNERVARENAGLYKKLSNHSKINIYSYFDFIHYKVWLFDGPEVFIGSPNLDVEKFRSVADTGVYCFDQKLHDELKSELLRDKQNSSQVRSK